ncbi:hypothetical protein FML86_17865, partial [Mycobacterium tuberculosis]
PPTWPGAPEPPAPPVAPQDPAGPAGLPGAGCSSRPITDQRATQQRLGGRIEGIEHVVLQRRQRCGVGRLRADIRADRGA